MTNTADQTARAARIALVGDRSPNVVSHSRLPLILDALAERDRLVLDAYWIPSEDAEAPDAVRGFDAVWVLPGSPYRSEAEGPVRDPYRACGGHSVPRYLRRVPARAPRVRP